MAGWEIAVTVVAGWFAVSFPVAVVIGKALGFARAPEPLHTAPTATVVGAVMVTKIVPMTRTWSGGPTTASDRREFERTPVG